MPSPSKEGAAPSTPRGTLDLESSDPYQVVGLASSNLAGSRVLMDGDTFAVFNRFGDIAQTGLREQGIYHEGTRFLSEMRLKLGEHDLLLLSSAVLRNNLALEVDLTNREMHDAETFVPQGSIHVYRSKFLRHAICYERIEVCNFSSRAMEVDLSLRFDSDFVDVFEVRGTKRKRRGEKLGATTDARGVVHRYRGLDDELRSVRLDFAPPPAHLSEKSASFRVHLESKQKKELHVWVSCGRQESERVLVTFETALAQATESTKDRIEDECSIRTSNEQFNDWIERSQADLRMVTNQTSAGRYPYAGVPWFSTPFGRDGIWTALEALWMDPNLAPGVLRFLASAQATGMDPEVDAEPGKIIHEIRDGEMAALGEVPFGRYYGSVDSTPLFLMLAAAYYETTADMELIETLWPHLAAACEWLETYGDPDGDGFVEYARHSSHGLVHQGWKDSRDSVFHSDGTAAERSIAVCEVQGYAYAARIGFSRLARATARHELGDALEARAARLRARFDEAFWCGELGVYALALDGDKLPCRVRSSNAGQCLYTQIALPERAEPLVRTLTSREMFSGWGIRTLSESEARYNPMSYHNGSVWPHDNAIIAAGLAKYGYKQEASAVLAAMFDASLFVEQHRLPELFCGFERRPGQGPTLYPVACAPQAWAAAAPFMLLGAILGLRIEGTKARVLFEHPTLPPFLDDIVLRNLRVGDARVDLRLHRYPDDVGVNVLRKVGDAEVVLVK